MPLNVWSTSPSWSWPSSRVSLNSKLVQWRNLANVLSLSLFDKNYYLQSLINGCMIERNSSSCLRKQSLCCFLPYLLSFANGLLYNWPRNSRRRMREKGEEWWWRNVLMETSLILHSTLLGDDTKPLKLMNCEEAHRSTKALYTLHSAAANISLWQCLTNGVYGYHLSIHLTVNQWSLVAS